MSESISDSKSNPVFSLSLFKDLPEIIGSVTQLEVIPSTQPEQVAREALINEYLGRHIRIQITDGRIYEGIFWAYDNEGTILMKSGLRLEDNEMDPMSEPSTARAAYNVIHVAQKDIVKIMISTQPRTSPVTASDATLETTPNADASATVASADNK